jgi:tetratricopeptide (TPR) repeat protein
MIKNSIITVKNVLFSLFCLIILSCRGNVIATDSDLSNFGWALYEDGEYLEALEWFKESIETDSSHSDAYNGAGWTMGQLRQAEEAVYFFDTFLQRDSSDFKDKLDFYAGLSFGYSAVGNDIKAREYAKTYFFGNQNSDLGDPNWCFCHKTDINMIDVRLILAISEFRLGLFQNCLSSINDSYKDLGYVDGDLLKNGELNGAVELEDAYPLGYDYTTISGRTYLANHLEILQRKLASTNGENELNCSENDGLGGGYCDQ